MDREDIWIVLLVVGIPFVAAILGLIFRKIRRHNRSNGGGGGHFGDGNGDGGGGGNGD